MNPFDPAPRSGFTLIELLVVMAIIATLFAIGLGGLGGSRAEAEVQSEAEQLAATLRRARTLAMSSGRMHGVAFNIQNAPGSTGAVLNNRSGGHYYRIIGPKIRTAARYAELPGLIPAAGKSNTDMAVAYADFLTDVQDAAVGEPHLLPPRRVRFLALADTDEGPIIRRAASSLGYSGARAPVWYGSNNETTYPRPYFGVYDTASKTLYGWGGYASTGPNGAATDTSTRARGLWYQGTGVAITGSQDTSGNPIPLVSAEHLDACIAFLPSGQAQYLEFKKNRRKFIPMPPGQFILHSKEELGFMQPSSKPGSDMTPVAAYCSSLGADISVFTAPGYTHPFDIPEVAHFDRHTGGYHITLAADAASDNTVFPDARTALRSIGSMQRVFVGRNGAIRVQRVQVRDAYKPAGEWWPSTPSVWLSTTNTTANPIFRNCRLGWLHEDKDTDFGLVPRGRPVSYIVSPDMLANRTWWCE